jgi:hypothetical protein
MPSNAIRLFGLNIRLLLLTFGFFMGALSLSAQTVDDLNKQADDLVHNLKEEEALQKYKDVLALQSDNLHALVSCSDMAARIGNRQQEKGRQKEYFAAAQSYAALALKADSNSSDANCMMAIALGRIAQTESGKKKVALARDVKTCCDKAIRLDKTNFRAWHVLGEWDYEISHLSGGEKAAAKVLFGGLSDATIKDAIHSYEMCRTLNRSFILNYLTLAKAYKEDDQNENALSTLQTLVRLPVQAQDDPSIKEEGRKMLDALM